MSPYVIKKIAVRLLEVPDLNIKHLIHPILFPPLRNTIATEFVTNTSQF